MVALDYANAGPASTLRRRVAGSFRNSAWILLAMASLGMAVVCNYGPIRGLDPYAHVVVTFSEVGGPLVNGVGCICGLIGAFLGARWGLVAVALHVVNYIFWPSFGFT